MFLQHGLAEALFLTAPYCSVALAQAAGATNQVTIASLSRKLQNASVCGLCNAQPEWVIRYGFWGISGQF
jgi:hypothetical protein